MIKRINVNRGWTHLFVLPVCLIFLTLVLSLIGSSQNTISAKDELPTRRVNMPYLGQGPENVEFFEPSIFWFGEVDPISNYADVRMWYYDDYMKVFINIIDRLMWYDNNPTGSELSKWDAVTLYVNLNGAVGSSPGPKSYRLVGQLNGLEPRANWQAAYRGNGTSWELSPISFTTEPGFRGDFNNDLNDKGWGLAVVIPFASLGLSGPPSNGTIWGLGVSLHDRDNSSGSPVIPDQIWPEQMDPNKPSTWGQLHFGRATFEAPDLLPTGSAVIQNGLNSASVPDAHVGGNFTCADGIDHWSEWGEANYAGSSQINIQNQWDISDYPCFSKYYITFPLDDLPNSESIISSVLTMVRFGNSGGGQWGQPSDSYVHVLTVGEDWSEDSLTWNNAPLPIENIGGSWVWPVQTSEQWQYSWDVGKAVVDALENGDPLRLALYSIDGDQHSGKYFLSSDWNDKVGRPRLEVTWGGTSPSPSPTPKPSPCETQGLECNYTYVPTVQK